MSRLEAYLRTRFGPDVSLLSVEPLGEDEGEKGRGYGRPALVTLAREGHEGTARFVLHRTEAGGFGRETLADRAHALLLAFETFNDLPGHVAAEDVGAVMVDEGLVSLREARDFYLLTSYADGIPYHQVLAASAKRALPSEEDVRKVDALASCLAEIHSVAREEPELYRRRIRELMGGNECIAGMLDSYDAFSMDGWGSPAQLLSIEKRCVDWRRLLKSHTSRLRRVHGDFHPWNILFDQGRVVLLDRSRGAFGEPADDVTALAVNFIFFSLLETGRLEGSLRTLWFRFFEGYLGKTGDRGLLEVLPPFLAFRALVIASPSWYPHLAPGIRRKLLRLADRVLDVRTFDPEEIDGLLEGA